MESDISITEGKTFGKDEVRTVFDQTVTFVALFLTLRHLQVHSCTTSRMQPMSFAGAAKLMKSQVGWHLRDPQHQLRVTSLLEASTNSALKLNQSQEIAGAWSLNCRLYSTDQTPPH